jgi:hypothetical protein
LAVTRRAANVDRVHRARAEGRVPTTGAAGYEEDFFAWTKRTASLLRARRFSDLDVEHLAEEIEDMGKRDRRELDSRVRVLLAHLLKWQLQPARQSRSWKATIVAQRAEIDDLLRDSPSLRSRVGSELERNYGVAVARAAAETGAARDRFPTRCPWSARQLLDPRFHPGRRLA